jgi:hypothetical protein
VYVYVYVYVYVFVYVYIINVCIHKYKLAQTCCLQGEKCLKTGQGWIRKDEVYYEHFRYAPACLNSFIYVFVCMCDRDRFFLAQHGIACTECTCTNTLTHTHTTTHTQPHTHTHTCAVFTSMWRETAAVLDSDPVFCRSDYETPNSVYTHCYDPTHTQLFVGGGPLICSLQGSYASVW